MMGLWRRKLTYAETYTKAAELIRERKRDAEADLHMVRYGIEPEPSDRQKVIRMSSPVFKELLLDAISEFVSHYSSRRTDPKALSRAALDAYEAWFVEGRE